MKWISVKAALPQDRQWVLVYGRYNVDKTSDIYTAKYTKEWGWEYDPWKAFPCTIDVTHWMELPEAPKETNDEITGTYWFICDKCKVTDIVFRKDYENKVWYCPLCPKKEDREISGGE